MDVRKQRDSCTEYKVKLYTELYICTIFGRVVEGQATAAVNTNKKEREGIV